MVLFLALASSALADTSEVRTLSLSDQAELFTSASYDTGWLPEEGRIQVRFQIEPTGSAAVSMEGQGYLSWPDAFELHLEGQEGTGLLELDAGLDLVTSIKFEIAEVSWEAELDRRGVDFMGEAIFEPFLLSGQDPSVVEIIHEGEGAEVWSEEIIISSAVSVNFQSELSTHTEVAYTGEAWVLGDARVESPGESVVIESLDEEVWVEVEPWLQGEWSAEMDLVLTPSVSVCIDVVGCVELASFDVEVPLIEERIEQETSTGVLGFGLPRIGVERLQIDLGEVELGHMGSAQVVVDNRGLADLDGATGILGSDVFSVLPAAFHAGEGAEDGVVVDFWPADAGEFSASLILESNDPYEPIVQIELIGTGIDLEPAEDAGEAVTASIRTCGCAGLPAASSWLGFWAVLPVLVARRRQAR